MTLPYAGRLLCLCLASFFLINLAAGLLVRIFARLAIRMAERMRSRTGARILFGMRLAPAMLAICAVGVLCVPSYLAMEPESLAESVGWTCLTAACLSLAAAGGAVVRGIRAAVRSRRYLAANGSCRFALAGLFRPRLIVSQEVMRVLSPAELAMALRHERAHWKSRDNLKRLFILLAPDGLLFASGLESLERAWARLAEWAADDDAVAGDDGNSLTLASALVRVARLGTAQAPPELLTALTSCAQDLAARVDRLLLPKTTRQPGRSAVWIAAALPLAVGLLAWPLRPATLSLAHEMLERLIR